MEIFARDQRGRRVTVGTTTTEVSRESSRSVSRRRGRRPTAAASLKTRQQLQVSQFSAIPSLQGDILAIAMADRPELDDDDEYDNMFEQWHSRHDKQSEDQNDDLEDNPQFAPTNELGDGSDLSQNEGARNQRRFESRPSASNEFSDLQEDEPKVMLAPSIDLKKPVTPRRKLPPRQRSRSLTGTRDTLPKKAALYSDRVVEGRVDATSEVQALKAAKLAKKANRQRRRTSMAAGETFSNLSTSESRRASTRSSLTENSPVNHRTLRNGQNLANTYHESSSPSSARKSPTTYRTLKNGTVLSQTYHGSKSPCSSMNTSSSTQGLDDLSERSLSTRQNRSNQTPHDLSKRSLVTTRRDSRETLLARREDRRLARQSSTQSLNSTERKSPQLSMLSPLSVRGERTSRRDGHMKNRRMPTLATEEAPKNRPMDDFINRSLAARRGMIVTPQLLRGAVTLPRQSSSRSMHERNNARESHLMSVSLGGERTCQRDGRMIKQLHLDDGEMTDDSEPSLFGDVSDDKSARGSRRDRERRKAEQMKLLSDRAERRARRASRKLAADKAQSSRSKSRRSSDHFQQQDQKLADESPKMMTRKLRRPASESAKEDNMKDDLQRDNDKATESLTSQNERGKLKKATSEPLKDDSGKSKSKKRTSKKSVSTDNVNHEKPDFEWDKNDKSEKKLDSPGTTDTKKKKKRKSKLDDTGGDDKATTKKTPEALSKRASTGSFPAMKTSAISDYDWEEKTYSWEKPEWTKKTSLKKTGRGDDIKKGSSLAAPVTHVNANKDISRDLNPLAKSTLLKKTGRGDVVKQGSSLAAPVTHINAMKDESRDRHPSANKSRLHKTERGHDVLKGGNLAGPVTHVNTMKDESRDKHPLIDKSKLRKQRHDKHMVDIGWQKPDWAMSSSLKSTDVGASVRQGKSLALPVTNIVDVVKEKESLAWQKPEWAHERKLKPSKERRRDSSCT